MAYAMMFKMCFLATWNHKDLSVIRNLQYNHECYMALALVKYKDLSSLLVVTFMA
jgi:hypothetical protein